MRPPLAVEILSGISLCIYRTGSNYGGQRTQHASRQRKVVVERLELKRAGIKKMNTAHAFGKRQDSEVRQLT